MQSKVGCVYPKVIWSEFRMERNKDDNHLEDAIHFIYSVLGFVFQKNVLEYYKFLNSIGTNFFTFNAIKKYYNFLTSIFNAY